MSCALLPAACSLCQQSLLRISRAPVCSACWNGLHAQTADLCDRCGEDFGIAEFSPGFAGLRPALCRPCELVPPAFERAVAFGVYEGPLRRLIHLLKYERMEPVGRGLGAMIAAQTASLLKDVDGEVLVIPVPLHRGKQQERGFNQAEQLATGMLAESRHAHGALRLKLAPSLLERKRATESQAMLSNHQRRRNLRGAFFVSANRAGKLVGRNILLVDDIYTTGATARACSKALKDAGAASVWVATVARAQKEGAVRWNPDASTGVTGFAAEAVSGISI